MDSATHIALTVLAILALAAVLWPRRAAALTEGFYVPYKTELAARFRERHEKTVTRGDASEGEDWLTWNVQLSGEAGMFRVFEKRPDARLVRAALARLKRQYAAEGAKYFRPLRVDYFADDRSIAYVKRANFIYVRFTTSLEDGEALFFVRHNPNGLDTYARGDRLASSSKQLIFVDHNPTPRYRILKDPTPPFPALSPPERPDYGSGPMQP